jgi:hypothetical protein
MIRSKKHILPTAVLITIAFFISHCLHSEKLSRNVFLYEMSGIQGNDNNPVKDSVQKILANIGANPHYPELDIFNPQDQTLFPSDIASPTFVWKDQYLHSKMWLIMIRFENNGNGVYALTDKKTWTPNRKVWNIIKVNSLEKKAFITILGINDTESFEIVTKSSIAISTSKDEVGAAVFYRQVPPSFAYAYKHPELCRWRLGDISSYEDPPIVLEGLPVCANCHSFSSDGKIFGMDMDYKEDKGAYALTAVRESILLSEDDFISWNNFQGPQKLKSMGLFSQISPDGRWVASTIYEKNFMALLNELDFSQLFLTATGLIACYDRSEKRFFLLSGADDPKFVQTCPTWSPDGKYIVFSRAKVKEQLLEVIRTSAVKITPDTRIEDLNAKFQIQYDLYRIPFNQGKGGTPEPLAGASHNAKSNYMPKYSPDGKWIVFTKSDTGVLLQPDSQLYIMPAEGGVARRMRCNTNLLNSWHSLSPNSRWLVFASKANTPFTQLFLTHIDENGNDSPPVLLTRLNSLEYAANIPELVDLREERMEKISLVGF